MEKRLYPRIDTEIYGTLYKDNIEIPIMICNMSENGIGIRYKYSDSPADFKISRGDEFSVVFYDEITFKHMDTEPQFCVFKTIQVRIYSSHAYIGGKLMYSENDYPQYVLDKKSERFIVAVRFLSTQGVKNISLYRPGY